MQDRIATSIQERVPYQDRVGQNRRTSLLVRIRGQNANVHCIGKLLQDGFRTIQHSDRVCRI